MDSVRAVIVNYRTPVDALASAQALLRSTGIEIAVSIIDNSAQDTMDQGDILKKAVASDSRLEVIELESNVGFAAANNVVLNHLQQYQEDFFAIINPDSIIEPDALKLITHAMIERDAAMAGGLVLEEDGTIQRQCFRAIPNLVSSAIHFSKIDRLFPSLKEKSVNTAIENFPDEIVEADAISGAFMVVSRKAIETVGAFDERYFMHVEDLDWCQRMHLNDQKILFVPEAQLTHEKGVGSATRPIRVQWYLHRSMWAFYRKFQANDDNAITQGSVALLIGTKFVMASLVAGLKRK